MMDLSENFLKLLQIAIIVTSMLALYFSFIGYNITIQSNSVQRTSWKDWCKARIACRARTLPEMSR